MNGFALNNIQNAYVGSTPAQAIYLGSTLIWPTTPHDYSTDYLTIVSLADNNDIEFVCMSSGNELTISVSTDNGSTWIQKTASYNNGHGTVLATLNNGDKLLLKGNNNTYSVHSVYGHHILSSNNYNLEGNIMSLIYDDNFIGQTTLPQSCSFETLFSYNNIIDASNCILPATSLTDYCYQGLFEACNLLITAPELPASTLSYHCYYEMFKGCTSLTTTPELPASTLAEFCYAMMFAGCTSLTTAPDLNATIINRGSYSSIFDGCTSLNYIKCLATSIYYNFGGGGGTTAWTNNVAASGTFVKDQSMPVGTVTSDGYNSVWTNGTSGIPTGWNVVNN